MDFPGGTVDGRPPANAWDMGLIPGLGGFHMLQSNWAHEPQSLSPASCNCWSQSTQSLCFTREATTVRSLCTAAREQSWLSATVKAHGQQRRSSATKHKLIKIKLFFKNGGKCMCSVTSNSFVIPCVRMIKSMASNWINDVTITLRGWTKYAEKTD